jgi:uncharacterized protein
MAKLSLLPKEPRFLAFFELQAGNIVRMAQQLKDLIYIWQNVKERAGMLAEMEQDGDAISHDILTLLNRSFVTPFDRDDISALVHSMDDISDRIHAASDALYLYKIESPTDRARELCDIILKGVLEVQGGVTTMSGGIRKSDLLKRCLTINQIEHSGDTVYRAAQAELFSLAPDNISLVKWREIYQKLESTINGCKTFANVLEGIAIKYG